MFQYNPPVLLNNNIQEVTGAIHHSRIFYISYKKNVKMVNVSQSFPVTVIGCFICLTVQLVMSL